MSQEQTVAVFEGLYRIVKNVPNPGECTSVERCIFSHLYDLNAEASLILKGLPMWYESFGSTKKKIHTALYSPTPTNLANHGPWDATFMDEAIRGYRRGGIRESLTNC